MSESEKIKGVVKWFNDAKGFGFIEHPSGRDVFVHFSVIESEGFKTLKDGEEVEYEIIEGAKGLHASKVKRSIVTPPRKPVTGNAEINGRLEQTQAETKMDYASGSRSAVEAINAGESTDKTN